MTDRQSLRQAMRERRKALSDEQQQAAAVAVARQLERLPAFQRARRIAAYLAMDGELELQAVIDLALQRDKQLLLPALRGDKLAFLEYRADTPLQQNRYGIPEPDPAQAAEVPARFIDLVLAPLVAFDEDGGRLGMGGGFYDRSFAFLQQRRHWRRPLLVGIAHDFQRVDALPTESWDVPLHGVITDAGWYPVSI